VIDSVGANSISTFGGNPLAMTAARATLDVVLRHDLQANARELGARLMTGLQKAAENCPGVGEVRGKGLMIGVELVEPGGKVPSPSAAARALEATKARGLLVGKGGLYGNVLRLAPPMTLTAEEADEGLRILTEALTDTA
jgi:4-aminobutyrate aminotransferase